VAARDRGPRLRGLAILQGGGTDLAGIAEFGGLTGGLRIGGGYQRAILNTGQQAAIRSLVSLGAVTLQQVDYAIATEATSAVRRIQTRWPVDTGFSRARWRRLKLGVADYAVANDANYAGHVHRKGESTPLADSLVPAEIAVAVKRITRRILTAIKRASAARGMSPSLSL
jgi:hypothetical protein